MIPKIPPRTATPKTEDPPTLNEIPPPTVQSVQEEPPPPVATEEPPEQPQRRHAYIEMAEAEDGKWHWCLWSANGRAMAGSITPFARRNDCQKNVETALELFRDRNLTIVATIGG